MSLYVVNFFPATFVFQPIFDVNFILLTHYLSIHDMIIMLGVYRNSRGQ
jgi:hypothetical protein